MGNITGNITGQAHERRRATIEDVAAAAGVSVATVSRAIRGLPNVALSTRERIERVADELSYRADPAAARLATGRSRSVALAVPLLNSWYFSQVVSGAEAVCTAEGYDMVVMGVADEAARRALLADTTSIHRRVDGLVLVDLIVDDEDCELLAERELAVVTIGSSTARFPSISIDDVAVGTIATQHLVDLGHTRIGLIGGQREDPFGFHVPDHRRHGYEQVICRAGIEPDPAMFVVGNFSVLGGRDAMASLLALERPPTAVFAMSDEMAFGALLAARDHGIEVPADLSVVGVDDHDVSIVLGLTTVRQSVADHGSRAARLLIDQLTSDSGGGGACDAAFDDAFDDGRVEPTVIEPPVELVVRTTTSAAAVGT